MYSIFRQHDNMVEITVLCFNTRILILTLTWLCKNLCIRSGTQFPYLWNKWSLFFQVYISMILLFCVDASSVQLFILVRVIYLSGSQSGFWTSSISLTRELIRIANFQAPPQIYRKSGWWGPAISVLTSSPGNSDQQWSFRTTDLALEAPNTHHPITQPISPFPDTLWIWPCHSVF